MTAEKLPDGWYMIRVEYPKPIIYTFGSDIDPITWEPRSTFQFFTTVAQFERAFGRYAAIRDPNIQRCMALTFDARMKEPFRIVRNPVFRGNDLMINTETLCGIVTFYSLRNDNPSLLTFKPRELNRFFERYTMDKNDALDWLSKITPNDRARAIYKILNFKRLIRSL